MFRGLELFWSCLGIWVQGFTVVVSTFFFEVPGDLFRCGIEEALDRLVGLGFGKP